MLANTRAAADRMSALATAYVDAINHAGVDAMVSNLATTLTTRKIGERIVPVTINRSEQTGTYVCSPQTAYIRYLREELATIPSPTLRAPLGLVVSGFDRLLRPARIDDIVHLNNWLLSTNLNAHLTIPDADKLTDQMRQEFPDSILCMRSLNRKNDRSLMFSLEAAGWQLFPSRQIWLVDDLAMDWKARRDTRRDAALAGSGRFQREELTEMSEADAQRICDLYRMLYLDKYSQLNPDYTPLYMRTALATGMLRFFVYRDSTGVIQSVAGCFCLGDEISAPIVGYDTARPPADGLYRLATFAILDTAYREGLRVNLSSGAPGFKRNRGARPEIEYAACFVRHLSAPRRFTIGLLQQTLVRIGVPILKRFEL